MTVQACSSQKLSRFFHTFDNRCRARIKKGTRGDSSAVTGKVGKGTEAERKPQIAVAHKHLFVDNEIRKSDACRISYMQRLGR